MSPPLRPSGTDPASTLRVVLVGALALAVAMGIGRFAFTPLIPLMLRDGTLDAQRGAEWAAANYIGYLLGALTAVRFGAQPLRGLRWALAGVTIATLLAGAMPAMLLPLIGGALRLAAGIFSAWAMVCASAWCMAELARRSAVQAAAWVYVGVGAGIGLTGLLTWLGGMQTARALWLELAALAAAGTLLTFTQHAPAPAAAHHAQTCNARHPRERKQWPLVLCYGAFGFGYIVPATFLPLMAREQTSHPLVFGLTWPLFGVAAALSVAMAARWLCSWPRRRVWAVAQGAMALGTAVVLVSQSLWALAASAALVGGTFMVATMAGLQLARELTPHNTTPLLARMTVAFATGQIAGPLLVRALGDTHPGGHGALWWGNAAATLLLVVTSAWLARGAFSHSLPSDPRSPFA